MCFYMFSRTKKPEAAIIKKTVIIKNKMAAICVLTFIADDAIYNYNNTDNINYE